MKKVILVFLLTIGQNMIAQLKIGTNSTTIDVLNNLEIESYNNKKVYVNKNDGRTYIENTPTAASTDSILFKSASGEVRQMSLARFKQLLFGDTVIVTSLNCAAVSTVGTLTQSSSASGVVASVPYTASNSVGYSSKTINSTGVLGLQAVLRAGTSGSSGNFVFDIIGTPTGYGFASFNFVIGGQSCTFSIPVSSNTTSFCSTYGSNLTSTQTATIGGKTVSFSATGFLSNYSITNYTLCGVYMNTPTSGYLSSTPNTSVTINFNKSVNDVNFTLTNLEDGEMVTITTNNGIPVFSGLVSNCLGTISGNTYVCPNSTTGAIAFKVRTINPYASVTISASCVSGKNCGNFAWAMGMCDAIVY